MKSTPEQFWDAGLYNKNYRYVSKYGEDLLNLLDPKKGQKILDLGCGTGHLTSLIASTGADVTGIDMSPEMISEAKVKYPAIKFMVEDATDFYFQDKFDSVFSNAVLHWIKDQEKVLICVFDALKKGGKFTAEFGGKHNIERVETALRSELRKSGYSTNAELDIWYYPSPGEYAVLLEEIGFTVNFISYFKRDTFLEEGDDIGGWLEMFGKSFFVNTEPREKIKIINNIQDSLKDTNCINGKWFIDYVRLRFTAVKE